MQNTSATTGAGAQCPGISRGLEFPTHPEVAVPAHPEWWRSLCTQSDGTYYAPGAVAIPTYPERWQPILS
eukprot:gene11252-biopygen6262